MAKICYYCGKKPAVGNKVSHSNRKTKTRWYPNLQTVHVLIEKTAKRVIACTACIRSGKVKKAA